MLEVLTSMWFTTDMWGTVVPIRTSSPLLQSDDNCYNCQIMANRVSPEYKYSLGQQSKHIICKSKFRILSKYKDDMVKAQPVLSCANFHRASCFSEKGC